MGKKKYDPPKLFTTRGGEVYVNKEEYFQHEKIQEQIKTIRAFFKEKKDQ